MSLFIDLLYFIAFTQVMAGAKQLHIVRSQGRATFRKRDNMVKVQVVVALTENALAFVTLPNSQFNFGWNKAGML